MRLPAFSFLLLLLCGHACRKESGVALRSFRELPSPVAADFAGIRMLDSLRGVAVGGTAWQNGFVLSTADGGQTWQTDTLMERKMEGIAFDRNGQAYVCGQDFALFREPGSNVWQTLRVNYRWNKSCAFPDGRHGAMVTGGAYRLGEIQAFGPEAFWQPDTLHETANVLADVQFSDSATAHAVGLGWVLRSDDAGRHWQRLDVTGDFFRAVCFADGRAGYICGSSGTLLKTTDGGQSWQEIRKGGSTGKRNRAFRSLCFSSADRGFVVGDEGLFWMTENGGTDWSQVEQAPDGVDFTGVFVLDGQGWAVAKGGRIFYFEF